MSHNIFSYQDAMAACSSGDGWLVNSRGRRLRTGNFPRGMATTPHGNLLGMSELGARATRARHSGMLRWYAPDWRFRTDYVLPRAGGVFDILDVEHEEYEWDALEPWSHVEITPGEYNRVAPGNAYLPSSFASCTTNAGLEWHEPEDTYCWTAARNAALDILINPGETRLWVEVSAIPAPYSAEIWLGETHLATATFTSPNGQCQRHEFCIPAGCTGAATLSFRVPHLWKPAELLQGSTDERLLGLAVHAVGVR
jgi:hypothetical protein